MQTRPEDTIGPARRLARILDSAFRVPGTRFRFGLDPILGLVPGVGDVISGGFGFYLLFLAFRAGAPPVVMLRMCGNIGADMVLGAVPLVGDLFDAGYKANMRNLALLERYSVRPEEATRQSLVVLVVVLAALLAILVGAIWLAIAGIAAVLNAVG